MSTKDIVVVTGYKRSGTSLMMRLLKEIGYEPVYNPSFDKELSRTVPKNEYFFEDEELVYHGFEEGELPEGSCVKVLNVEKIPMNVKVIYMHRPSWHILNSLKEYKSADDIKHEEEILKNSFLWFSTLMKDRSEEDVMFIDFDDLISEPKMVLKGGRFEKLLGKEVNFDKCNELIWKR